jgi:cyclopropane-fatty-acyl-phospholipid synthase
MKRKIIVFVALASPVLLFFWARSSYGSDKSAQNICQNILECADIQINGSRPWDIKIHNKQLYARVLKEGSLGLGEAYMDGWWDCDRLDELFYRLFRTESDAKVLKSWSDKLDMLMVMLFNYQTKSRAFEVGEKHYDLSNDLFKAMLDKRMIYSCAYWKNADNLDMAQEHKLDLICKKLELKPGMRVLDIGCGWGGFARYAAEKYGAHVTGITISKEQLELARSTQGDLPLLFLLQDYRDCTDTFDRIVSVGMFEHVGHKNYKEFMQVVHRCLKDDGMCLLHTIGSNVTSFHPDPWISKYIFPNGMLPSLAQITQQAEGLFVIEDVHNFGADYDKTLMAWAHNFNNAWPKFEKNYNRRFYRMWNYYLYSCAGLFRARGIQLWQVVLSKKGVLGGYRSVR